MKKEKTDYSHMFQFRLFGVDFFFGYFKIKKAATDAMQYGTGTVNTILERHNSDIPKIGIDLEVKNEKRRK